MDIGIGPLGDVPGMRGTPADICDEVVETAVRAEDLGFDSAWLGERHLAHETVTASAPFTLAAAVARATESVRIGTSIAIAPLHHPIRLVEQAATVDAVSEGRFTFGAGIGYVEEEFDALGIDRSERVPRLLDAVELFDAAADHEPLAFEGRHHEFEGVRIEPAFTQDPRPPVLLGGTVESAIRRAARVADGYIGIPAGPGFYRTARAALEDELGDDYDDFAKGVMVNAFVADSTEAARETVVPGLGYLERRYARWMGFGEPDPEEHEPDTSSAVFGEPAEVAETLTEYRDALGENVHLLVRLHYPAVPRAESDRAMELFADEVLPELS